MIYKSKEGKELILGKYREILSRWPVENRQFQVATDFGDTFVIESGNEASPPLFLLHGSVSNSFLWFGDVAALSGRYHVFAIDIPGEAGLSAENRPPCRHGVYARWLEQVRDGLNTDSCSLAGLSLGGWMALDYAAEYPRRVDGLVLLCPGGLADERTEFLQEAEKHAATGDDGKQKILEAILGGKTEDAALNEGLLFTLLIGEHFNPRMEKLPVFSGEALQKLTMPVLLICGEKDFVIDGDASMKHLCRHVPQAQAEVLPGVGHAIVGQASRILDFLG